MSKSIILIVCLDSVLDPG